MKNYLLIFNNSVNIFLNVEESYYIYILSNYILLIFTLYFFISNFTILIIVFDYFSEVK